MPLPAVFLIIATVLPLVSFTILVFVGKRMGNPLAGIVGTVAIGTSFAFAMATLFMWLAGGGAEPNNWGMGKGPINHPIAWVPIGTSANPSGVDQPHPGFMDVGVYVDSLTVAMFSMITLVATLIHIFSIG